MKQCAICGKEITTEEPAILFVGVAGEKREICPECEGHMDTLSSGERDDKFDSAAAYFIKHISSGGYAEEDHSVVRFITNILTEQDSVSDLAEDVPEEEAELFEEAEAEEAAEEEAENTPEAAERRAAAEEAERKALLTSNKISLVLYLATIGISLAIKNYLLCAVCAILTFYTVYKLVKLSDKHKKD